ncbi:hypothetical protein D9M70_528670 [compost metagenome]
MLGGQHQDGDGGVARAGAQAADQGQPVHAGHDLVGDQHAEGVIIRSGGLGQRMRLLAVGGLGDVEPAGAQACADHAAKRGRIVDDEDAGQ